MIGSENLTELDIAINHSEVEENANRLEEISRSIPGKLDAEGEDMPPLPPLPPMQWRIGKFHPPSIASPGTFLPMQPIITEFDCPSHPPNPLLSIPNSQHLHLESTSAIDESSQQDSPLHNP